MPSFLIRMEAFEQPLWEFNSSRSDRSDYGDASLTLFHALLSETRNRQGSTVAHMCVCVCVCVEQEKNFGAFMSKLKSAYESAKNIQDKVILSREFAQVSAEVCTNRVSVRGKYDRDIFSRIYALCVTRNSFWNFINTACSKYLLQLQIASKFRRHGRDSCISSRCEWNFGIMTNTDGSFLNGERSNTLETRRPLCSSPDFQEK